MANPGSRCTRGLSPGTPIGHETTGGEFFAIDTSGVEEDEQPRDSGRLQGSAVSSSGASLFVFESAAVGHETAGGETFAIDTSGVEEDEQPRDSGRLQGSAVSSSGASLFVSGSLRTAEILRHNDGVVGDGGHRTGETERRQSHFSATTV